MVKKIGIFVIIAMFGVIASAIPIDNEISDASTGENLIPIKNIAKCAEAGGVTGIINCAAMRALKSLQYVNKQSVLEIVPGVTLTSDSPVARAGKELSEEQLPADPQEKTTKLMDMLVENGARLISGRTLKVKLPENIVENVSRALEEGRKKKKKGGLNGLIGMFGIGAKMMAIIPAIMGFLAILSTKAFIVAKLALVLSVIVFFQYFGSKLSGGSFLSGLGGGHGQGTGFGGSGYSGSYGAPTWTTNQVGGGSQYPYARSIDVAEQSTSSAHDLAYAKQH